MFSQACVCPREVHPRCTPSPGCTPCQNYAPLPEVCIRKYATHPPCREYAPLPEVCTPHRPTNGRYGSYWNASLFQFSICHLHLLHVTNFRCTFKILLHQNSTNCDPHQPELQVVASKPDKPKNLEEHLLRSLVI